MFLSDQLHNTQTNYNLPFIVRIAGAVDPRRLQQAFNQLIKRHEILRTSLGVDHDNIVQRVATELDFQLKFTQKAADQIETSIQQFIRPFDLSCAPLFRAELVEITAQESILLVDFHHSIADATTIVIFTQELADLYSRKELPALQRQYRDYVVWETEFADTGEFQSQEAYWLDKLTGTLPLLELPLDFARPKQQTFNGDSINYSIPPVAVAGLNQLGFNHRVTLNVVLVAIYSILLGKYSGQDDLIIGTVVSGRQQPNLKTALGTFINTLPLRIRTNNYYSVAEFLKRVGAED